MALTPKAFDLLAALVEQPGRLISKDELLHKVWPDTFVEESNLAYNVFGLRKALGDAAESGLYIETVPKRGYRFTAAVTLVGSEPGTRPVPATPAELHGGLLGGDAEAPSATKVDDAVAGGASPRRAPPRVLRRVWPLAAAAALVLALTLYLAAWSWRAPRNAEPRGGAAHVALGVGELAIPVTRRPICRLRLDGAETGQPGPLRAAGRYRRSAAPDDRPGRGPLRRLVAGREHHRVSACGVG